MHEGERFVESLPFMSLLHWFLFLAFSLFAFSFLAVGFLAVGFLAVGLFAVSFLAVGLFAVGLFAVSFFAVGFLTLNFGLAARFNFIAGRHICGIERKAKSYCAQHKHDFFHNLNVV